MIGNKRNRTIDCMLTEKNITSYRDDIFFDLDGVGERVLKGILSGTGPWGSFKGGLFPTIEELEEYFKNPPKKKAIPSHKSAV